MIPGRSALVFLLMGAVLAALAPSLLAWSWRSPGWWFFASLLWQGVGLVGWTIAPEPGFVLWGERAGAFLTAIGLAAWSRSQPPLLLVRGLVGAAAGVLSIAVLGLLPWCAQAPAGPGLPFGNPNFNVGGAVPLLGLAVFFLSDRVTRGLFIMGVSAALVLGTGLQYSEGQFSFGDAARAVWVGLIAMMAMAVILRAPARLIRCQAWLISSGVLMVIGLLVTLVMGGLQLPFHSPSVDYRLALWRCASEAIVQAPLVGGGPGSPIISLQEQVSSPMAWLSVPSYAEHAHNEYLNVLLEGGVLGALLLLAGVLATLIPLWQRRTEPLCAAFLVAWSGVLAHALIESHLSQPGPLLLLAMLAGGTWAVTQEATVPGEKRWLQATFSGLVVLLLAVQIGRDFTSGGTPPMLERRAYVALEALPNKVPDDWLARAAVAQTIRQRLGNLDKWLTIEATARAHVRDYSTAEALVLVQVARLPVDAEALDLLLRLRDRYRKREQLAEADRLAAVLKDATIRARLLLQTVPVNSHSRDLREKLTAELTKIEATQ